MTTPTDTYLPEVTYQRLKEALAHMVAQPFEREGTDAETEVIHALGEIGGVWPVSVLDDAESCEAA